MRVQVPLGSICKTRSRKYMVYFTAEDVTLEPVKGGIHAGGQHAQKNATGIRATHRPTGLVVVIRGRSRKVSIRRALRDLCVKVHKQAAERRMLARKARRKAAIHNHTVLRTYNFIRGVVIDHRTKRTASIKDVLGKGNLDKLKG